MTIHKTLATRSRRHIEQTVATHDSMPINGNGRLLLSTSMGDLRTMAISKIRARLIAARETAGELIKNANTRYKSVTTQLETLAREVIKLHTLSDEVIAMRDTLQAWLGRPVEVLYEKPGASREDYYRKDLKPEELEPEIDTGLLVIRGEIRFRMLAIPSSRNNTIIDELAKLLRIQFTPEMEALVTKLTEIKTEIDARQQDLNSVNRQIAELIHKGDDIQGALTEAHLRGELKDEECVLEVITRSVSVLALPAAVAERMKALPG